MKTQFTKAQLLAALKTASKDHTRHNLWGILVEPNQLVSLDGHRLSSIRIEGTPTTTADAIFVDREEAERLSKMGGARAVFQIDGTALTIDGRAAGEIRTEPNTFPDYRQILESAEKEELKATIRLNARYLAEMATEANKLGPEAFVDMEIRDTDTPAMFRCGSKDHELTLIGVIMPIRK